MPYIQKKVAGKAVEVDLDEVWDSICKILRIARLLTNGHDPNNAKYVNSRLAMLAERLCDLEGLSFAYKKNNYFSNIWENFVPEYKTPEEFFVDDKGSDIDK